MYSISYLYCKLSHQNPCLSRKASINQGLCTPCIHEICMFLSVSILSSYVRLLHIHVMPVSGIRQTTRCISQLYSSMQKRFHVKHIGVCIANIFKIIYCCFYFYYHGLCTVHASAATVCFSIVITIFDLCCMCNC